MTLINTLIVFKRSNSLNFRKLGSYKIRLKNQSKGNFLQSNQRTLNNLGNITNWIHYINHSHTISCTWIHFLNLFFQTNNVQFNKRNVLGMICNMCLLLHAIMESKMEYTKVKWKEGRDNHLCIKDKYESDFTIPRYVDTLYKIGKGD